MHVEARETRRRYVMVECFIIWRKVSAKSPIEHYAHEPCIERQIAEIACNLQSILEIRSL